MSFYKGLDKNKTGTLFCQKCLKNGHNTYECENERVYQYRPSLTMVFE